MRVAICLFGQPRNYNGGYNCIKNFIDKHNNIDFDIFYHTWHKDCSSNSLEYYDSAPWSHSRPGSNELIIQPNTIEKLNNLYKPTDYIVEEPKRFDYKRFEHTLAFKNTAHSAKHVNNISNILSQCYSRNKVRNILNNYINKYNIQYDFVIHVRFDYVKHISINLNDIDLTKIYAPNNWVNANRIIITDPLIMLPQEHFLNIFNLYDNLENILNNNDVYELLKKYKEKLYLNSEELILASFFYYNYSTENDIIFTPLIPSLFK